MKKQNMPVVLEPYAFSSLLMATIEIPSRESIGFLIGHLDRQFIKGRMGECVSVNACYPVQSAFRGRIQVGFSNLAARHRVEETVKAVGFGIVGGFHSHPTGSSKLSDEDAEVVFEELNETSAKANLSKWIEIVVGVKRIKRPEESLPLKKLYRAGRLPGPGFSPRNVEPTIMGDLLAGPKLAYRIEAAGYWFEDGEVNSALLCYSRY
jgi:proteasome lid subunit RPN8/RPN11